MVQGRKRGDSHEALRCQREITSAFPLAAEPLSGDNGDIEQAGKSGAGCDHAQHHSSYAGTNASKSISLHSESHASADHSLLTPTRPARAGSVLRSGTEGVLPGSGCSSRPMTPTTACTTATDKVRPPRRPTLLALWHLLRSTPLF